MPQQLIKLFLKNCLFSFDQFVYENEKGGNHPMLILYTGYRQVTMLLNKQEQFTPNGREPSELLALSSKYWRYSYKERQEPRLKYLFISTERNLRQFQFSVNKNCLLIIPLRKCGTRADGLPKFSCTFCFLKCGLIVSKLF